MKKHREFVLSKNYNPSSAQQPEKGFFVEKKSMLTKCFVLASNSPRRIALLKLLGYPFDIIPHGIAECLSGNVSPADLVKELAFLKASDVARRLDNALIISADTIIWHDKTILGKPRDTHDAKRILSVLSDSEHDIISGVCILDMPSKKKLLRIERTHIRMKKISAEEIEIYVASGEPMDKAGAYAVQGEGKKFIEKIEGSYSNAVGLPLGIVREMIDNFIDNADAEKF